MEGLLQHPAGAEPGSQIEIGTGRQVDQGHLFGKWKEYAGGVGYDQAHGRRGLFQQFQGRLGYRIDGLVPLAFQDHTDELLDNWGFYDQNRPLRGETDIPGG